MMLSWSIFIKVVARFLPVCYIRTEYLKFNCRFWPLFPYDHRGTFLHDSFSHSFTPAIENKPDSFWFPSALFPQWLGFLASVAWSAVPWLLLEPCNSWLASEKLCGPYWALTLISLLSGFATFVFSPFVCGVWSFPSIPRPWYESIE